MRQIQIHKIKVQKVSTNGWGTNQTTQTTMEDHEVFHKNDLQDFKDVVTHYKGSTSFSPGQKVMFDKQAVFPRKKFKEAFPDNKIVTKLKEADILFVDFQQLKKEFQYFYTRTYVQYPNGNYEQKGYGNSTSQGLPEFEFYVTWHPQERERIRDRVNFIYEAIDSGKALVDVKYLSIPSEVSLTAEAFERISQMFGGGDDMINTAMRILTAYDYNKDKSRIGLMMKIHGPKWKSCGNKKVSVEVKTLLKQVSADFPGWEYQGTDMNFWFKMALENQYDPIIQKAFQEWIKSHVKIEGNIKLVLEK
jgi:hypothetical protein